MKVSLARLALLLALLVGARAAHAQASPHELGGRAGEVSAGRSPSNAPEKAQDRLPEVQRLPPAIKALPRAILLDQKQLWLRPLRLRRSDLPWTAVLLGGTAALVPADRGMHAAIRESPPGRGHAFSQGLGRFSGAGPELGVAGAFYLVGRWRANTRAQTAGVLGLRALANSIILVETLKTISRRPRPSGADGRVVNRNAAREAFTSGRSFPSGHAAQAWALATVIAHEYGHRPWVPPTAYALAGAVAFARVTARKHFPSDAFAGSVIGYLIGRHVLASQRPASSSLRWDVRPHVPASGGVGFEVSLQF